MIPCNVLAERRAAKKKGMGQMTLDGQFFKAMSSGTRVFLREDVLKLVAEFVVCDDQVSWFAN